MDAAVADFRDFLRVQLSELQLRVVAEVARIAAGDQEQHFGVGDRQARPSIGEQDVSLFAGTRMGMYGAAHDQMMGATRSEKQRAQRDSHGDVRHSSDSSHPFNPRSNERKESMKMKQQISAMQSQQLSTEHQHQARMESQKAQQQMLQHMMQTSSPQAPQALEDNVCSPKRAFAHSMSGRSVGNGSSSMSGCFLERDDVTVTSPFGSFAEPMEHVRSDMSYFSHKPQLNPPLSVVPVPPTNAALLMSRTATEKSVTEEYGLDDEECTEEGASGEAGKAEAWGSLVPTKSVSLAPTIGVSETLEGSSSMIRESQRHPSQRITTHKAQLIEAIKPYEIWKNNAIDEEIDEKIRNYKQAFRLNTTNTVTATFARKQTGGTKIFHDVNDNKKFKLGPEQRRPRSRAAAWL